MIRVLIKEGKQASECDPYQRILKERDEVRQGRSAFCQGEQRARRVDWEKVQLCHLYFFHSRPFKGSCPAGQAAEISERGRGCR